MYKVYEAKGEILPVLCDHNGHRIRKDSRGKWGKSNEINEKPWLNYLHQRCWMTKNNILSRNMGWPAIEPTKNEMWMNDVELDTNGSIMII